MMNYATKICNISNQDSRKNDWGSEDKHQRCLQAEPQR